MRISDWSSDVCSSDLYTGPEHVGGAFDVSRRFGTNGEWGVRINGTARQGDVAIDDEFRSSYVLGGAFDYNSGPLRLALDVVYQRVKVRHQRPKLVLGSAIPAVPEASTNYGQPWQYQTGQASCRERVCKSL